MPVLAAAGKAFGKSRAAFRSVSTYFWMTMLSIPRVFHVPDVDDPGFSLLTGGTTSPSRSTIWDWMGRLKTSAMKKFRTLTEPVDGLAGQQLLLSLDPHSVPCFTRKYAISKAYHTIRNKYMKLEQLVYFYDLGRDALLALTVTPAAVELHRVMRSLVTEVRRRTRAAMVRIVLDAAAMKGETEFLALMNLPGVQVIARAVRSPKYMKQWRAIPEGRWTSYEEPDETKGRPPRVIEVANTTTRVGPDGTPVRTIVAREYHGRNRKECYHVLYTNVSREHGYSLVKEYRHRQRHEQAYRVGVHDLNLDALTHGYEKDSQPEEPTFDEARVGLVAWIKALAFNALNEFKSHLPEPFSRMTAGSLIRHFILRPGKLYATADELIVELAPHPARGALEDYVQKMNAEQARIPWLGGRRLRIVLADEEVRNPGSRLASVSSPDYIWC
jgi:hypothetical protein